MYKLFTSEIAFSHETTMPVMNLIINLCQVFVSSLMLILSFNHLKMHSDLEVYG